MEDSGQKLDTKRSRADICASIIIKSFGLLFSLVGSRVPKLSGQKAEKAMKLAKTLILDFGSQALGFYKLVEVCNNPNASMAVKGKAVASFVFNLILLAAQMKKENSENSKDDASKTSSQKPEDSSNSKGSSSNSKGSSSNSKGSSSNSKGSSSNSKVSSSNPSGSSARPTGSSPKPTESPPNPSGSSSKPTRSSSNASGSSSKLAGSSSQLSGDLPEQLLVKFVKQGAQNPQKVLDAYLQSQRDQSKFRSHPFSLESRFNAQDDKFFRKVEFFGPLTVERYDNQLPDFHRSDPSLFGPTLPGSHSMPLGVFLKQPGDSLKPSSYSTKPSIDSTKSSRDSIKPSGDSTKPSGDYTKPSGDSTKPSGDSTTPSGDSTKLSGDSTKPSIDSMKPSGACTKPSGDSKKPSGDSTEPSGDSKKPSGDSKKPSGDSKKPSGDSEKPSGDSEKPSGDSTEPSGDSSQKKSSSSTGQSFSQTGETGQSAGEIIWEIIKLFLLELTWVDGLVFGSQVASMYCTGGASAFAYWLAFVAKFAQGGQTVWSLLQDIKELHDMGLE